MKSILSVTSKDCTATVNWSHSAPIQAAGIKKNRHEPIGPGGLSRERATDKPSRHHFTPYILSIMTWPKPEQLTWVAPSIKRAKSYVTFLLLMDFFIELMIRSAASIQPM